MYEFKITTAHPILKIMFENILRTFEVEILKIFKNILPQPKNETFFLRVYVNNYNLYRAYCTSKKGKTFSVIDSVMDVSSGQSC